MNKIINNLNIHFSNINNDKRIGMINELYSREVSFANSLDKEAMIISDIIFSAKHDIEVFTIDTGRLPESTYQLIQATNTKYNSCIKTYYPDNKTLEQFCNNFGHNAFKSSYENRTKCCYIRKILPLKRALTGKKIWISSRRNKTTNKSIQLFEWDNVLNIIRFNPLYDWSDNDVSEYIKKHSITTHKLHEQGFEIIGCEPCTRAISKSNEIENARWWWEKE